MKIKFKKKKKNYEIDKTLWCPLLLFAWSVGQCLEGKAALGMESCACFLQKELSFEALKLFCLPVHF